MVKVIRLSRLFLYIISFFINLSLAVEAKASEQACSMDWSGSWALTAEKVPFAIYTLRNDGQDGVFSGEVERYSQGSQSLFEASIEGQPMVTRLEAAVCEGNQITLVRKLRDGRLSQVKATALADDCAWLELLDLPKGGRATRYALQKLNAGAQLSPEIESRNGLAIDIWGQDVSSSNSELREIFAADQALRRSIDQKGSLDSYQRKQISLESRNNVDKVKTMQMNGELSTGLDYYRGAFILQHGSVSSDFLMAHHFAMVALAKGYDPARWIAAATIDRYLQSIGQSQIYGTQTSSGPDETTNPYDSKIVQPSERLSFDIYH